MVNAPSRGGAPLSLDLDSDGGSVPGATETPSLSKSSQGLLMEVIAHAADIQDRDGGVLLMASLFGMYPSLLKLHADIGYQGPEFRRGLARVCRGVNVEIVRRCDTGKFVVLSKRWIVERTIAWLNRCRRLSRMGSV